MNNNYKTEKDFDVNDYESLLDAAGQVAIISMTDVKGNIIFVNDKFMEVSKYSKDELVGQNHRILKSGKQSQEMFDTLWKTISSGNVWRGEIVNRAKDGTYYWVDTTVAPILGDDGKPVRYIAVRFLITEQKEFERKNSAVMNVLEDLKEEREKLAQVSNRLNLAKKSAKIGVWDWDVVKNVLLWDDQMYTLYGIKKEDFDGAYDAWQKGLHPDDKKPGDDAIQAALKGEKDFATQFRVVWPNGEIRSIQAHAIVERDPAGKPLKMVGVNWDITKETIVDRAKTEFVSLASHQLRTPLATIGWYAEMLADGDAGKMNKQQKEFALQIMSSNKRMIELVNSLLNVSRIDMGTLASEPVQANIADIADAVFGDMGALINGKKLSIEKKYEKSIPYKVDSKIFGIVLQNLISNAVKYTPDGGHVGVSLVLDTKSLRIEISDTGYGIPEKAKSKIFTKLYRADNVLDKDTDGNGLGLYLVKSIIEEHGGKISFDSTEGKGTTFHIELPASGMKQIEGSRTLS